MSKRVRFSLPEVRWPSEAEAAQSLFFSPIRVGPLVLTSRSWVPAMVPWRASESGEVNADVLDWYGRFARGRPGALVVEATGIRDVPSGPLLRINDDRYIAGLSALAERIRASSGGQTKSFIQLIDFLPIRRRPTRERYLGAFLSIETHHRRALGLTKETPEAEIRAQLLALSDEALFAVLTPREREALEFGARERVTDVERPAVRDLPALLPGYFARAAARAERAGFDGVELHYAHAYTMASFLSRTNDRGDGYGQTPAGRVRLAEEVYRRVRAAVSPRFVVGCRMLSDEAIPGGSDVCDARYYAEVLARAGIDYVSLSKGGKFDDAKQPRVGEAAYPYTGPSGYECMPTIYSDARGPFGRNLGLAQQIRLHLRAAGLGTPIVAAGGIQTFVQAEAALADGSADLIAAARQSLADPDWFEKTRLGAGERVRRCALTNYCEGLDQHHKQVTCRLWDRDFDAGETVPRSSDGKRRLVAPPFEFE